MNYNIDFTQDSVKEKIKKFATAGISAMLMTGCTNLADFSTEEDTMEHMDEKNIIFIQVDQLAAASLNCYGGTVPSSPAIDSLSEQGMRFERAYAVVPVCAPNRACILTSRSRQVHGVNINNQPLEDGALTFAGALRSHGYYTGAYGKFHQRDMRKDTPADPRFLGFDEGVIVEDTKWGHWLDWVRVEGGEQAFKMALGAAWTHGERQIPPEILAMASEYRRKHYLPRKNASVWHQVYESPLDARYTDAVFITNHSLEFMERHLEKRQEQPFLLTVSYIDPHDPYDPPAPYSTMFQPEDMPYPIPNMWEEEGVEYLLKNQSWLDFKTIADDPEAIRVMRAHYHGKIRMVDDQIKRIIDYVKENNLWDDTVIVFTADHGDMMGDHGLIAKYLPHYDKSIRVPLLVAGGGVLNDVSEEMISSMDFFPTFLELAGIPLEEYASLEGKSFAGTLFGTSSDERWDKLLIDSNTVQSVITKEGFRYTRVRNTNENQLFNLKEDPDELNNLVMDPEYEDLILELDYQISLLNYRHISFGPLIRKDYFGEYPANVWINDCRISFDDTPFLEDNVAYFPLEKLLFCAGVTIEKNQNHIFGHKAGRKLVIDPDGNYIELDEKRINLQQPILEHKGVLHASAKFLVWYFNELGYSASYNEDENILRIIGSVY